ncbi:response regulator [Litoreibacter janthinus]|uniref:DNA-binding response regulator, OmpR family, contains REC and winged-helix (WHTH) domain n=1 Tax=Litoreibacter janthinus TaxID=670154 RepID=A0A1I6H2J0_9RHOB|nr:response regulator transcription factor [Litoreibacter janthinus]SFR48686.1 DNA-binding response regulator, OmpR family, contains REC and winged-helix (wHTH) domain [Litoreibacter janthinus]
MRILYVEDNERLALNTSASLQDAGFVVDTVHTAEDALHAIKSFDYDATVLDLGLPDRDGLSVLPDLKSAAPQTPVIICTARDALDDRIKGLNTGSDDYLIKPFAVSELVARINALLRRQGGALGIRLFLGNITFETTDRTVSINGDARRFTKRELALLELLLRRAERVVSKDAIENALYSFDEPPTPNAIEVLTHRLRKKLIDMGATVAIHNLRGIGYVLQALPE